MEETFTASLASQLINTVIPPANLPVIQQYSAEARAYHKLNPYPFWALKDWRIDERGVLPRCLPLAQKIVKRGALWLFGKPITLTVAGNSDLEEIFTKAWKKSRMPSRLRAIAEDAALDGGVVLKFSVDETDKARTISFQSLSVATECRLWFQPHDRDKLLMARVQYPYLDPLTGTMLWYREEWTAEEEVHYGPLDPGQDKNQGFNPDTSDRWQIISRTENPFGLIPMHLCRNLEEDDVWGGGDMWSLRIENHLYRVFDRVNLTTHMMDRSNQFDSQVNPIFLDAEPEDEEDDKPLDPGQPLFLNSTNSGEGAQGKVVFPPTGNALRPNMSEYADRLSKAIEDACSSVSVDTAEITNKGNMTVAVLQTIYQPQIEITNEKRKSMGDDGIAAFLALAAQGLQNAGMKLGVTDNEESRTFEIGWSDYFEPTEEEKGQRTDRAVLQVNSGLLTQDRAVERIAKVEGIHDVKTLKDEIAAQPDPLLSPANSTAPGSAGNTLAP
jgi:hypothetical protein